MDSLDQPSALQRRERAADVALASSLATLAWVLVLGYGVFGCFEDDSARSFLALSAVPHGLAALATRLCRCSREATSWLFVTWVFLGGATALFLIRFTLFESRSGFLSELISLLPTIARLAVVLFAAVVAALLYRRDPARF